MRADLEAKGIKWNNGRKPGTYHKTTPEVRQKIWQLKEEGKSITAISEETGLSRPTVYQVLDGSSICVMPEFKETVIKRLREGSSIRELVKDLRTSKETIRKIWQEYSPSKAQTSPVNAPCSSPMATGREISQGDGQNPGECV